MSDISWGFRKRPVSLNGLHGNMAGINRLHILQLLIKKIYRKIKKEIFRKNINSI